MIWQVGDTAYYLGLLGSVIAPLVGLALSIVQFQTWGILLRGVGLAAVIFLACFPAGMLVSGILKGTAEQFAGVE